MGLIESGKEWEVEPREVDIVLELSVPDLIRGFEMQRLLRKGLPIKTPTYTVEGNLVWGATARILQDLLERLDPIL